MTPRQRLERAARLYAVWARSEPSALYAQGHVECGLLCGCLVEVARTLGIPCRVMIGEATYETLHGTERTYHVWLRLDDGCFDPKEHLLVREGHGGYDTRTVRHVADSYDAEPEAIAHVLRRMRARRRVGV